MEMILKKKSFASWVKKLGNWEVFAPLEKEGLWTCEPVADLKEIPAGYPNTVGAPKKIIFPQREVLFEFDTDGEGNPEVRETLPEKKDRVIFAVRPCDGRAVTLTDIVFGGDISDPYYGRRRESAVLVGLACNTPPSSNCFCPTVGGSPHSTAGLDVLMTDLGDSYAVETLTDRGRKLVARGGKLFVKATDRERKETANLHGASEKKISRAIENVEKIPGKLKKMFDAPFWDEKAMGCIRCGICTFLCPACHCFDISDELTSSSPAKGMRVRTWDTCQFPDFTMHSSGHNPRPDRASRLRQRLNHKFQYFVEHHGEYQCTGCGRCISLCPVSIDIIDILSEVPGYER
jgi:sulfhydrogenase subunit beta (sulfur reductase)